VATSTPAAATPTKNHLEGKIDRLEQQIHDLRNILNDIKNKVDRLN
jgi:polyhydroxyalkanoate synthesis regulator phasin